jgi:CheY-like chemotaxis protein
MTATQPAEAGPVDILIAEDDVLMRQSLRRLLEQEGYHCAEADDGRAAVEMARRSPPRCAILDLVMPGMDGFTVARQLRADPRTRGVHIHCLTGVTDLSAREEARQAGFETYLTKPVDPSHLLRLIDKEMKEPVAVEASGLSLTDARDLLDYWENAGYQQLKADYDEGKGFTVRGVRPPA